MADGRTRTRATHALHYVTYCKAKLRVNPKQQSFLTERTWTMDNYVLSLRAGSNIGYQ